MTAEAIAVALGGKRCGTGWKACCPAHDDHNPSLTISEGDQGRVLVHCKANCSQGSVIAALKAKDLWGSSSEIEIPNHPTSRAKASSEWFPMVPPPNDTPEASPSDLRGFTIYEYRGLDGELLFYIRRKEATADKKKAFYPLVYGKLTDAETGEIKTGWHSKHAGTPRPLYRLDAMATRPNAPVMLCAGEKATHAAQALFLDYVAMTWSGGETDAAIAATDWKPLQNKSVTMWPDNDTAGRNAANQLQAILPHMRIIRVDDLSIGHDAADVILDNPMVWLADRIMPPPQQTDRSTELVANLKGPLLLSPGAPLQSAREFVLREHTTEGFRTLYHQNSKFYTWEKSHYLENSSDEMRARLYSFLDKAKSIIGKGDKQEIVNFDPTKLKVANVMEAAAAETQLYPAICPPAWLNDDSKNPNAADVMACSNGLVDLTTRSILRHTPAFFTLNALDYAYDHEALEPTAWLKFLNGIWPNDQQAIDTLQEIFGLSLTGETRYQKAFLLVGPKRSGKGTIARVLTRLNGAANVCGPTLSNLSQNFGIAPLINKRLAIISDARLGGKADQAVIVERILAITGEDCLTVDRKNREAWTGLSNSAEKWL